MAVLTSPPRIRPRFGPQAGLIAAARGVAFAGLMLAGLGLLIVIVAALFFTALGTAALIVGTRGPQNSHMLLALVVLGTGLGLARFAVPPVLLGVRAQRLVITERAVAKHTASIFLKLDLQPSDDDNRRVLAVLAYLGG